MRGRFIKCTGCPTEECTCFTELEQEMLDKNLELLKALGFNSMSQFVASKARNAEQPEYGPKCGKCGADMFKVKKCACEYTQDGDKKDE